MRLYRLAVLLCSTTSALTWAATQILTPEIDTFINNLLSEWNVAGGAAIAVVRLDQNNNWTIETKGYGNAKGDGTKVDSNTIFSLGSNSKVRASNYTVTLQHNLTLILSQSCSASSQLDC